MTSREGQGFQDWAELRTATIDRFNGETPHPATEQDIIRAYELHPDAVEKAIGAVAAELQAGVIHSGWGILRHRAEAILKPPRNPTVKHGRQREKQLQRAEQWTRQSGMHFDRWSEVEDVLRHDYEIPEPVELAGVWRDARLVGVRLEREATERAEAWKASRAALKHLHTIPVPEHLTEKGLDPEQVDDPFPPESGGASDAPETQDCHPGAGQTPPAPPPDDFPPKETP